jgi:hypothetical protein
MRLSMTFSCSTQSQKTSLGIEFIKDMNKLTLRHDLEDKMKMADFGRMLI